MAKADHEIPFVDISGEGLRLILDQVTEEEVGGGGGGGVMDEDQKRWKEVCLRVREACEEHGCFILKMCDNNTNTNCKTNHKIPPSLRDQMFEGMKSLFDLPHETKSKYVHPKPYRSYSGNCSIVPLHESFGIDDAHTIDAARSFTNLMWPQDGSPAFCETLSAMSSKMLELNSLLLKMIFESFGMERRYKSQFDDRTSLFRVMKYNKVPPGGSSDSVIGLVAHTDKNALTILCQNGVQGLQVQTKDGDWVQVVIPQDAFFVVVGDALKAWSNGRLHAARHRVMISPGDRERYSCALFLIPKEGATIEVPDKLVDKDHPLLYRPFNFADYISYFVSKLSHDALETYAGI